MTDARIVAALAGNPNSGKTTVFNSLTGARQHVGNWPGVTVEKKEGYFNFEGKRVTIVDLPGVYSLTAYSLDEVVARDFIVDERPDVVIDIVDASNLERNLYLTVQLMEMQVPLVIGLNMMDVAKSRGYEIDIPRLSELLGAPVIPMVAAKSQGVQDLMKMVVDVAAGRIKSGVAVLNYGSDVENEIVKLEKFLTAEELNGKYSPRWLAVKLLENDREILEKLGREVDAERTTVKS